MLCQNCNLNESTIHLYTSINGKQRQIDLCQNCYQIMKTDPKNPILGGYTGNQKAQQQSQNPFFDDFLVTSTTLEPLVSSPIHHLPNQEASMAEVTTVATVPITHSQHKRLTKVCLRNSALISLKWLSVVILILSSDVTMRLSA